MPTSKVLSPARHQILRRAQQVRKMRLTQGSRPLFST